jgi:hypothetical protein
MGVSQRKYLFLHIFFFLTFKQLSADDCFLKGTEKSHFCILHGFLNYKTFDLLIHLKDKNTHFISDSINVSDRTFAIYHIIWQLIKFSFFYKEAIDKNKFWFINFKIFGFEYGPKYKFTCKGEKKQTNDYCCIFEDQDKGKHKCILSRVSIFSIDGGIELNYKKSNHVFNRHYFACSIALGIGVNCGVPDVIIRYCPFIYSYKNNFYLRLELIQLSIGNIVSSSWSYKNEKKEKETKTIWKNIFVKGIFHSILYNIKIEISKDFDIM